MKTIDDSLLIPQLSSGDKLYHYTSASALHGISNGEFWVTERRFLNDYTEFQIATDVFCEILNKHMKDTEKCKLLQERVRIEIAKDQDPDISEDHNAYSGEYVASFCLDYDSPLMWSSYSDFAGYCIQFDYEKLLSCFSGCRKILFLDGAVIYDRDQQINCLEETIKRDFFEDDELKGLNCWQDLDTITGTELEKWIQYVAVVVSAYNMFFKLPCFKGEREYRFVFMVGHSGGRWKPDQYWVQHFRTKDEVLIPFIKVPIQSVDSINKVLVGSKNKSDIAVKGVQCLFHNLKHDIIVERSELPLRY